MSIYFIDTTLSDEEVMEQLCQGHPEALPTLFDRFYRLVLKVVLRILRDPGEAEDVMQDLFFEIFNKAAQFDPAKGSTKTWILQYAYHRGTPGSRKSKFNRPADSSGCSRGGCSMDCSSSRPFYCCQRPCF